MNSIKLFALATTLAAATAAHAALFVHFDHDQADLVSPEASFVFAAMNWSGEIGGEGRIKGALTGRVTHHGGNAGCAKVQAFWKNEAGTTITKDLSATTCTSTSAPSLPLAVNETFTDKKLGRATLQLLVKRANSNDFVVVDSRSMRAGGG